MNAQKLRFAMLILVAGVMLLPAITAPQAADKDPGIVRLRYVTIVVRDYDQALKWYTNVLGLEKTEEGGFGTDKRWLVVAPRGRKDVGIILEIARPYSARDKGTNLSAATGSDSIRDYEARVGKETRWVFEVEDCRRFYDLASKRGVKFVETPVDQPWGVTEAMFEDLYGNLFVVESFRPNPGSSKQ
jgi:catechol 2,3-dioxygenase-like lactoylglutathione lyase family enzyme